MAEPEHVRRRRPFVAGSENRTRFGKPSHGRGSSRRAGSPRSSGQRESGRLASRASWSLRPVKPATVAIGRCLSYGEAITYHPLIEIVRQLAGEDPDEGITTLMGAGVDSELVARRMRGLVGLSDETAPAEETFWAVRKLFEAAAAERPLIVVFDDVHWAEPLLLDLIEYLVGSSAGKAIFVVCLARPELLETRPSWAVEDVTRSVVTLEALPEADARRLVESLTPGEVGPRETARIVRTAEGNPLFLEQLVATGRGTRRDCDPTPDHPGRAGHPYRWPRSRRAHGARASLGRRPELHVELGRRASLGGRASYPRRAPDDTRPQTADPARTLLPRRLGTRSDSRTC